MDEEVAKLKEQLARAMRGYSLLKQQVRRVPGLECQGSHCTCTG